MRVRREPIHGHDRRTAAHMNWNTPMLFGLMSMGYLAAAIKNRMDTWATRRGLSNATLHSSQQTELPQEQQHCCQHFKSSTCVPDAVFAALHVNSCLFRQHF